MEVLEKLLLLISKRYPALVVLFLIVFTIGFVGYYLGLLHERTRQQKMKLEEQNQELQFRYKHCFFEHYNKS